VIAIPHIAVEILQWQSLTEALTQTEQDKIKKLKDHNGTPKPPITTVQGCRHIRLSGSTIDVNQKVVDEPMHTNFNVSRARFAKLSIMKPLDRFYN
jgi:hypothetical protein